MEAYEDMIRNTATKSAPWYVVPADNKWFARIVVVAAVIDALDSLDLKYPKAADPEPMDFYSALGAIKGVLADKPEVYVVNEGANTLDTALRLFRGETWALENALPGQMFGDAAAASLTRACR